jgi:predicted DNA-binding protein with PD1-like motif
MTLPTFIQQPGPSASDRIISVEGRGRAFTFELEPGLLLLEAVRKGFTETGFAEKAFESGVLELKDVALTSFAYVMPALSKTPANAAFYSEIFKPAGITRITSGAITFGRREGAPFFHCHAVWHEADGKVAGGHILPDGSIIAERITVTALGLDGAAFEAVPDPETNFTLFRPIISEARNTPEKTQIFALRLRPNQDFTGALEAFCVNHKIHHARIRGGVGSTIGVHFDDGRIVENFATEVFIRDGMIAPGPDGTLQARIDVALVDYTGAVNEGVLLRGRNPVLMTFELVLEVIG